MVTVVALTVEGEINPLGLDALTPRLGWRLESARRGAMQTAYRIQVAADTESLLAGDCLADTGEVASAQSQWLPVPLETLEARRSYRWRVQVRDEQGQLSEWSAPGSWEMGLLSPSDWQARWIAPQEVRDRDTPSPAPMVRHEFVVEPGIVAARLYASAQGLYVARLNGHRVGDALLTPGWTSYADHIQYQTYDVLNLLRPGDNAMGAILGDGWFRGNLWPGRRNRYGESLAFLCQLELVYADGRHVVVGTSDRGWTSATGAIRSAELYTGEVHDARLDPLGWDMPGFDASGWAPVVEAAPLPARLVAQSCPPVRRIEERAPVALLRSPAGDVIADFGQNLVGWTRITVSGPAGTVITLRHAEMLDRAGNLYTDNLQSASQTDTFISRGDGLETFEPSFTCHGFRYVQIDGVSGDLTADMLTAVVCHSDLAVTGSFSCSEPLIDRLQSNIAWSLRDNFVDIPTDCPQRAERMGWTADVQLIGPTAAFNMDVRRFLTKWLRSLIADQQPDGAIPWIAPRIEGGAGAAGWGDAITIIPWMLYERYGDLSALAEAYHAMTRWVDYMVRRTDEAGIWTGDFQFADWLDYVSVTQDQVFGATPRDLVATAYLARSADIMVRAAQLLGQDRDAAYYGRVLAHTRQAFVARFFDGDGVIRERPSQAGYVLALDFDLLPDAMRPIAAARLAADVRETGHLTTGFLGTPRLLPVLTRFGYVEEAYQLIERREIPSWLYPVTMGATTIWERWDGVLPDGSFKPDTDMNSFNHYLYGSVGEWLYESMAGLGFDPAEPAYRHIRFSPQPGGSITSARARHIGPYGPIAIAWRKDDGGHFACDVEVPPNSRATLILPGVKLDLLREAGVPVTAAPGVISARECAPGVEIGLGAGSYRFETAH